MEELYQVYVKLDVNSVITDINSNVFISDLTGWTKIDEGNGDMYVHAQSLYLPKGLMDSSGKFNYKLVNGLIIELSDHEKATLFPDATSNIPTTDERLTSIESAISALMGV